MKTEIAEYLFEKREKIEEWFQKNCPGLPAPLTHSVDLRDSGYKIVPVDSNLYPGGFHHVCETDVEHAPEVFQKELFKQKIEIKHKNILIITEDHTQNAHYFDSLYTLTRVIEQAGYTPFLGRMKGEPLTLDTHSGHRIYEELIRFQDGELHLSNSDAKFDFILLNHDLSEGYPEYFDALKTPIRPTHLAGWYRRKKSNHFEIYNRLAADLCQYIDIDPFLLTLKSEKVSNVDFQNLTGMDALFECAERMLGELKADYEKRKIDRKPALFIKNDSGTYGMGIMVIEDANEIKTMNRRTRNKMSVGKGNSTIHQVIVQEGVPTQMLDEGHTSEPVIYQFGQSLMGGFIRANTERSDMDNLNSKGMFFKKLCFKDLSEVWEGSQTIPKEELPTLEVVYGMIARLSTLAATHEIKEYENQK